MQRRLKCEQAAGNLQQSTGRGSLRKASRTWEKLVWGGGQGQGQGSLRPPQPRAS